MWSCPKCGEMHDDHFDICWKCASPDSVHEPAVMSMPPLPERKLRPFRTIFGRALLGFFVGSVLGLALFHSTLRRFIASAGLGDPTTLGSTIYGLIVGVLTAFLVAMIHWIFFPYEPLPASAHSEPMDEDEE